MEPDDDKCLDNWTEKAGEGDTQGLTKKEENAYFT